MDERELMSDSDESDEDYVPPGAESSPPSEEESGAEDEPGGSEAEQEEEERKPGKRKLSQKSSKKKVKKKVRKAEVVEEAEEEKIENEEKVLTEEEEKKKADSLWSDFMKDTGAVPRSRLSNGNSNKEEAKTATTAIPNAKPEKENKVKITKVFEFAGEEVRVTKEVDADSAEARLSTVKETKPAASTVPPASPAGRGLPARSSGGLKGLSSVLGQLGKKPKLGTLEKSKLDWEKYKHVEGIQEELQAHNKGKDGYLERQDFLQRTDLRQFEREKAMRAAVRKSNR